MGGAPAGDVRSFTVEVWDGDVAGKSVARTELVVRELCVEVVRLKAQGGSGGGRTVPLRLKVAVPRGVDSPPSGPTAERGEKTGGQT